jgi:hypothetical protein
MLTPTSKSAIDQSDPVADPSMLILQLVMAIVAIAAAALLAIVS